MGRVVFTKGVFLQRKMVKYNNYFLLLVFFARFFALFFEFYSKNSNFYEKQLFVAELKNAAVRQKNVKN